MRLRPEVLRLGSWRSYLVGGYVVENLNGERDAIQLIIDMGLANSTYLEDTLRPSAFAVIDNRCLVFSADSSLSPSEPIAIIRDPPQKLIEGFSSKLSDDYLKTWYRPLMRYLEQEDLLQYFNIPS